MYTHWYYRDRRHARPEPSTSLLPAEPVPVLAGCGHEVYPGERLFTWPLGKRVRTLCPDCIAERFDALPLEEKAALLGCEAALLP